MNQQRFFFSHLRRGVRTVLTTGRTAEFDLVLDADGSERVVEVRDLPLAGPEHARGIVPTAIRKRHPPAGSVDLRAGELPYVEWHDAALPWALTPQAPSGGRLSPFIALVCLPEATGGGTGWLQAGTLPLPRALVQAPEGMPDPAAFALTAHVEDPDAPVNGAPGPRAFARLLCPQRLQPRTRYIALVVPLFESGRLAGLGKDVPDAGAPGFAWTAGATSATLPVYLSWRFATGAGRGAEDMLRDLFALPPEGDLPRVPVDADAAGALMPPLVGTEIEKRAVFAVRPASPQQPDPALAAALDVTAATTDGRLPMPAYARIFAGGVEPGSSGAARWYDGANLDASLRVMAGYGTAVVRRRQDEIVGFVLDSAGQIEEANAILSRAHTAMALTRPLHAKLRAPEVSLSALDRLLGPAAARTWHSDGSIGRHVAGTVDEVLQDPTLRRALAAGGSLDRDRASRGDLADAVRTQAAAASEAPVVPGATPIGPAMTSIDASTSSASGTIDAEGADIADLLDRLSHDPSGLREDPELTDAHDQRRERQDEDRRRPDQAGVPGEVASSADLRTSIVDGLRPGATVPPRIADQIDGLPAGPLPQRILAEPVWPHPIIPELFALDPATLSPGLSELPDDGVMALSFDAAAIDAVVLGANTEVLRELRWRGVPHDPLSSPVRRVFPAPSSAGQLPPDTLPIRGWDPTRPLGGGRAGEINFVVLIRSQLFRKYPETVITLVESKWNPATGKRELDPNRTHLPRIMGRLGEDITYVGFSQDRLEMVGDPDPASDRPGGFLVFEQPDGGLSFGLNDDVDDIVAPRRLDSWNELAWSDLTAPEIGPGVLNAEVDGPLVWGTNSATMAAILVERRVTVALHVSDIAGEATP